MSVVCVTRNLETSFFRVASLLVSRRVPAFQVGLLLVVASRTLSRVAMAGSSPPESDALEKRRVLPRASEPQVTAPSTRRRVLVWRAAPQPQATPLPGRRVESRGARANGDEVSAANWRFPESWVGRTALGVLVGALLALATDVGDVGSVSAAPKTSLAAPSRGGGAVAFLFLLTEGRDRALPHDHLWSRFFRGQDRATFLVRVHAPPGFAFTDANTAAPEVFIGTEVREPVDPTAWGTVSIVKAQQKLLRSALSSSNPVATAFALLSEWCIPVRPFPFARAYLLDREEEDAAPTERGETTRRQTARRRPSFTSFVESSPDRHARWPGLYDPDAAAALPRKFWREGSRWFALTRRHAEAVAADVVVVEAFRRFCSTDGFEDGGGSVSKGGADESSRTNETRTRTRTIDGSSGRDGTSRFQTHRRFCAPDEHFVPTLLALRGFESELEPRGVTYANWWPTKRRHPKRFSVQETSFDMIRRVANKTTTDDAFEGAGVSCGWWKSGPEAGTEKPCWLFARKFTAKAGRRVAAFASVAIGY